MNISKQQRRERRATPTRAKIRELGTPRLTVHRTPRHIYAQLFAADGSRVLAAASTVQKALVKDLKYTGNVEAARVIGRAIAERAKAVGVARAAFDRSGFQYHGRVKALAEAAREAGLEF